MKGLESFLVSCFATSRLFHPLNSQENWIFLMKYSLPMTSERQDFNWHVLLIFNIDPSTKLNAKLLLKTESVGFFFFLAVLR